MMSKVDMNRLNLRTSGAPVSAVPPVRSQTNPPPPEPT